MYKSTYAETEACCNEKHNVCSKSFVATQHILDKTPVRPAFLKTSTVDACPMCNFAHQHLVIVLEWYTGYAYAMSLSHGHPLWYVNLVWLCHTCHGIHNVPACFKVIQFNKNLSECVARWSKTVSKRSQKLKKHSKATQTFKRTTFFWPVPPWGNLKTPPRRLQTASETK